MASRQMEQLKKIMTEMMSRGFSARFDGDLDPNRLRSTIETTQSNMRIAEGVDFIPETLGGTEAEAAEARMTAYTLSYRLAPDNELLAQRLREAGIEVEAKAYDGCFHVFAAIGRGTPESAEVLENTLRFIERHAACGTRTVTAP